MPDERQGRRLRRSVRAIVAALALASTVATPPVTSSPAPALAPGKVYRVGIVAAGGASDIRETLREVGYVEGRNLVLEIRDTEGKPDRANDVAGQLARLNVDVIIATHPGAVFAAKRATATIPIVMVHTPDPVELGLVTTLARPGGNVTGTTTLSVDLSVKQLELLREAVPGASRVAVVANPDNPLAPAGREGSSG